MKILALVFLLFGFAAAVSYKDLVRARDEVVMSFMIGMEKAPSLQDAMGMDFAELDEGDRSENEIKSELMKRLKDAMDTLLQRIKESIENGKRPNEDLLEPVEKIMDEFSKLHVNLSGELKERWERVKERTLAKLRDRIKEWRLKWNKKESEEYAATEEKFDLRKFLEDLRSKLQEKGADLMKLKEEIKEKLKDHALFIDHVDEVGKKTAGEDLEFFLPYKQDLATLWDELVEFLKEAYGEH